MAEVGDFEAGQQAAIDGLFLPIFSLAQSVESGLPGSVAKAFIASGGLGAPCRPRAALAWA
jgi:hypothetical protein